MIYEMSTLPELMKSIDFDNTLFCDTETRGLYGNIRLFQCFQKGWERAKLIENPNNLELVLLLSLVHNVWHNAHYDLTTISKGFVPAEFDDTFLLARLAEPQYESYSLDDVMDRALGFDPYEQYNLNKAALQKSFDNDKLLTQQQKLYAAIDVFYLPEVWDKVKSAKVTTSYLLDKSVLCKALKFQGNGMPIDSERLDKIYSSCIDTLRAIPWVSNRRVHVHVEGQHKIVMPFNPNSPKQVKEELGLLSSDKKTLSNQAVMHNNQEARNVLIARTALKQLSFIKKYASKGERLYGKFKPSARSGRFTSDDENLQQIPRALKTVFGTDKSRVLIFSDYAQLELRTICADLGVKLMEKMFRDNVDLHGYVASVLFGQEWTKDDRQVTKTYNFNLLYGGSVGMVLTILITYGMFIEERLASRHKAKWLNLFPEINRWQQECISKWRKGKLYSTPLGREYKAKLMTDFMNIRNQGAGAEVAKLALHYMCPWLDEYEDVFLCNFIHDSFIIEAPNDSAIYIPVAQRLAESMQEAWFEFSKLLQIKDLPMPINVKVGHNWGDLEKDIDVIYQLDLEPYAMLEKVNAAI